MCSNSHRTSSQVLLSDNANHKELTCSAYFQKLMLRTHLLPLIFYILGGRFLTYLLASSIGRQSNDNKSIHTKNLHPSVIPGENVESIKFQMHYQGPLISVRGQKILLFLGTQPFFFFCKKISLYLFIYFFDVYSFYSFIFLFIYLFTYLFVWQRQVTIYQGNFWRNFDIFLLAQAGSLKCCREYMNPSNIYIYYIYIYIYIYI